MQAAEAPKPCMMIVVRPGPTFDNYKVPKTPNEPPKTGRWSSLDSTSLSSQEAAQIAANIFRNIDFDLGVHTKAARTKETLEIILKNKSVEIIENNTFYEMEIGPLEGKDDDQIIAYFKEYTGYPAEHTKETLPNVWARCGSDIKKGNHCLLDKWHPEIDTFDNFYKSCLPKIMDFALTNLGKTVLVVSHGTPMKSIIAKAKNIPVHSVICNKGSS